MAAAIGEPYRALSEDIKQLGEKLGALAERRQLRSCKDFIAIGSVVLTLALGAYTAGLDDRTRDFEQSLQTAEQQPSERQYDSISALR